MKNEELYKNYIKSQRFKYLLFGLVVGYIIMLNDEPIRTILILVIAILAFGFSLWFEKKSK